jgi:hypothetical protein
MSFLKKDLCKKSLLNNLQLIAKNHHEIVKNTLCREICVLQISTIYCYILQYSNNDIPIFSSIMESKTPDNNHEIKLIY